MHFTKIHFDFFFHQQICHKCVLLHNSFKIEVIRKITFLRYLSNHNHKWGMVMRWGKIIYLPNIILRLYFKSFNDFMHINTLANWAKSCNIILQLSQAKFLLPVPWNLFLSSYVTLLAIARFICLYFREYNKVSNNYRLLQFL